MADGLRGMVWIVGTWHAAVLLVAFFAVAHAAGAAGPLTAAIGTLPGVLAFLWLWAVALWSAWRVLEGVRRGMDLHALAGMYGAGSGAVFVAGAGGGALVWAFVEQGWDVGALLAFPFVAIGAAVASLPGALVGWLLMGIDQVVAGRLRRELSPPPQQAP